MYLAKIGLVVVFLVAIATMMIYHTLNSHSDCSGFHQRAKGEFKLNAFWESYPDEPISGQQSSPLDVTFVNSHRSALSGEIAAVKGFVVGFSPRGESFSGQPTITLAEKPLDDRASTEERHQILVVYLNNPDACFSNGQSVEIRGQIKSRHDEGPTMIESDNYQNLN